MKGVNKAQLLTHRNNKSKTAVCFIHGFGGDAESTWGDFPRLIKVEESLQNWDMYSIGYNTNLMPDVKKLWTAKPDIQKLADSLRTIVNFHFKPNYKRLVIIAHSMGGLLTQRALLDTNAKDIEELIHSVILFGTPSKGLKKANFFTFFNQQIKDMGSNAEFIDQLRKDWNSRYGSNLPFTFLAVAGDLDEFVPAESSLSAFSEKTREVTSGNHVDMVKPTDRNHLSFDIVRHTLETNQYYEGRWDGAEIALELGAFAAAKNKFESNKNNLDRNGQIKYAFSLEALGNTTQAIEYLSQQMAKPDTDVMGTLGGRWKRLWLNNSIADHADHALNLYTKAFDIATKEDHKEQIYYHAINLAFFHLLYKQNVTKSQEFAQIAKDSAVSSPINNLWKYATLGEANIYLQKEEEVLLNYKNALNKQPKPRQKESMYIQWQPLVQFMGMDSLEKKLNGLFMA